MIHPCVLDRGGKKMECELCGRQITEGNKVRVEGSIVVACDKCSVYGEIVERITLRKPQETVEKKVEELKSKRYDFDLGLRREIINDCGIAVKEAREQKKMRQEELAKKINEPVSLIKKIESGRMTPNTKIAKRIEGILEIKLIEETEEEEMDKAENRERREVTLGDVITIRKKRRG